MMKNHLIFFSFYFIVTCCISQPIELNALQYEDTKNLSEISELVHWALEGSADRYFFEGVYHLAMQEHDKAEEKFRAGVKARRRYPYNYLGLVG